jgi:hypothetical protein
MISGRRLAALIAATLLLSAVAATSAVGFFLGDYSGHVKGDPEGGVGFDVGKENGHRKVAFAVFDVQFTCNPGTDGRSQGMGFAKPIRVHDDGTFKGEGNVRILKGDPTGKVEGKIGQGKAHGSFRIKGELDGVSGSECDTGLQEWRATRTHPKRGP